MKQKEGNSKTKLKKKSVDEVDDLILKRIAGASIINHRPLFSNDGEILLVIWKQVIRAYSAQTGDFVKELEPVDCKIINIVLSHENPDTIVGCTENAELVHWNSNSGLITYKTKLLITEHKNTKIRFFRIIYYKNQEGKNVCNALISLSKKEGNEKYIYIELYDFTLGCFIRGKKIEQVTEDYHLDIVGNYDQNLIVLAQKLYLYVFDPSNGLNFLRHKTGKNDENARITTCISGHPEEECVAVGDSSGRILVWKNLFEQCPAKATYHWHTLPVTDIVFSKSGGHMYSGGGECVLVKWLLSNPRNNSFLPRLPGPIKRLAIANRNVYVAVSTMDNGITIVNSQKKVSAVIQNFTRGAASPTKSLFPAGVAVDPRTNSLVLNSRTGHIQFYNTHTKSLLYNQNITTQNFLTQERNTVIVNTEVTKVAINDDGTRMATVEERDDKISHVEIRLKFWHFDMEKQIFSLNTSVELPHEKGVNSLKIRPKQSLANGNEFAVTVGKDSKFKIWNFEDSTTTTENVTKHWGCYSVGDYRNLSALDAGFSTDGSLIGVGFGSTLTLWVPETMEMKKCLSHSRYSQPIVRVEFGKQELCHLVVTASNQYLAVWDLLSLTIKWSVPINLSILAADPLSTFMAAFTTDNILFVFTPLESKLVYTRKNVLEKDVSVMGACFVPNIEVTEENLAEWQQKSQLFFLSSEQELLTLESKSKSSIVLENLCSSRKLPLTAFNRIQAAEKISNVEKLSSFSENYIKVNKAMVEEFFNAPAHTLPPMRILCASFLLSLMGKSYRKITYAKPPRSIEKVYARDSDSEEENVRVKIQNHAFNPVNNKEESKKTFMQLDWSFLSSGLPSDPPKYDSWNC